MRCWPIAVGSTPGAPEDAVSPTAAAMAVNTFHATMLLVALVSVVAPFHNPIPPVEFTRSPRKPLPVDAAPPADSGVATVVASCCMPDGRPATSPASPPWVAAVGPPAGPQQRRVGE